MKGISKRKLKKLLAAVKAYGTQDGIWIGQCPMHEGEKADLKLRPISISRIQVECTDGCQCFEILGALGFEMDDDDFRDAPVSWKETRSRALQRIGERHKSS